MKTADQYVADMKFTSSEGIVIWEECHMAVVVQTAMDAASADMRERCAKVAHTYSSYATEERIRALPTTVSDKGEK